MPPKKKAAAEEENGDLKFARFGRVSNNLKMGLVGLPNVGKSSLFNLLTEQHVAEQHAAKGRELSSAGVQRAPCVHSTGA